MANENLGEIKWQCHAGASSAFIRKDKRSKYYIYCPKCGIFGAKGHEHQKFILENATMYGSPNSDYSGGGDPEKVSETPEAQPEAIPEKKAENFTPEPEAIPPKKPEKVGGILGGFLGGGWNDED